MDLKASPTSRAPMPGASRPFRSQSGRHLPAADLGLSEPHAGGLDDLVELDPEHPGFRDNAYRARRNAIARLALEYRQGEPVPLAGYTAEEHGVWRAVWESLDPLHQKYACAEYRDCAARLRLDRNRIPQLVTINEALSKATGFAMLPVAGLVSAHRFLRYLGRQIFLSTQYIRHHSMPLYTPEPDVVHELIGHAATFIHPGFVALNRAFGKAAERVEADQIIALERLYWYTLEFGVVEESGARLKVYGAGLLSSFGELGRFESETELRPFSIEEIIETPYDPTDYQRVLFVAPSFAALSERLLAWLGKSG